MNRTTLALVVAICRRDLQIVIRSRAVSLPIVILPVVLFVLLPALLILGAGAIGDDVAEFEEVLAMMPELLRRDLAGLSPPAQVVVWGLEYVFATFFLIVPLMTSAVIAADSFAGEKERKTLEALVYTPTSDLQLFVGKLAGPWLAAMAVAIAGYLVYVLVVNLFGASLVGRPLVLTTRWLLVILWLAPAVAALAVGVLVLVSARVRGFQEAYQLGGLVVLPVVVVLVGQVTGVLYFDVPLVVAAGALLWAAAAITLGLGFRSFRRERLLVQVGG
jgi:ABC-2 type transport system permease protein